jgi:hypothetical protein
MPRKQSEVEKSLGVKVATEKHQIINSLPGREGTLYSENLY